MLLNSGLIVSLWAYEFFLVVLLLTDFQMSCVTLMSSSLFWSYVSQVPFIGRHTGQASHCVDRGSHTINHNTFTTYSEVLQKH